MKRKYRRKHWNQDQKERRRAIKLLKFNSMTLSKEMQQIYPYETVMEMLVKNRCL